MSKNKKPGNDAKRLARLAAVQSLYQMALTERPVALVIGDFRLNPQAMLQEIDTPPAEDAVKREVDFELFSDIMNGVATDNESLDGMIAGAVDARLSADRMEPLLRAVLRAGVFELHSHAKVPTGVIINDYVDIAHAFFGSKEPGLVNAILDKLAKNLRATA